LCNGQVSDSNNILFATHLLIPSSNDFLLRHGLLLKALLRVKPLTVTDTVHEAMMRSCN
jgi:hypothetical protein